MDQIKLLQECQLAYQAALLSRDQSKATAVIDRAIERGLSLKQVYLKVILSTQKRLGDLWQNGKLSIADEHLATQISLGQLSRIRPLLEPIATREKSIVVCAVTRDQHTMGARVVADFFILDGWTVHYLGGDLPEQELVKFVIDQKPDLLALSITVDTYLDEAADIIKKIRELKIITKIMIGGGAVTEDLQRAKQLKADVVVLTAEDVVTKAQEIFGLSKSPLSLRVYLKKLGARLRDLRKARRINQKTLAQLAGLDRAYISGVENGKQNISIGALFRVSEALEMSMENLLAEVSVHAVD